MKTAAWLLLPPLIAATPAEASSPAAWKTADVAVRTACARASGLAQARTGAPVLFSDRMGKTAALVTGVWPQARMQGRRATMVCLYDRREGRAEASEASGWSGPR